MKNLMCSAPGRSRTSKSHEMLSKLRVKNDMRKVSQASKWPHIATPKAPAEGKFMGKKLIVYRR